MSGNPLAIFQTQLQESFTVKSGLLVVSTLVEKFVLVHKVCLDTYLNKGKILIAGYGGSAADAQHFAG